MPLGFKELNTIQLQIGISETPNRDCYKDHNINFQ